MPDFKTNKGLRDRVLIGLLLECGLRRDEAAMIDVQQFQSREGRAILANVKGKGQRVRRTVPVPSLCATRIRQWIKAAKITDGPLLRPVDRTTDQIASRSMTAPAIYRQILEYAGELNLKCAPRDLRRTLAKLAYAKDPNLISQIKEALGRRTTEIYLGVRLNLKDVRA
jgi:integrase/recombinase XerD